MPLQRATEALDLILTLLADLRRRRPVGAIQLLDIAQLAPQCGVLGEVASVARHRLLVAGERLLGILHLPRQADDRAIRLELRERRLEDLARAGATELVDEIDGHVVGRTEARVQRIRAAGGERGHGLRVETLGPLDDRVTLDVDAATAGASGELGVLPAVIATRASPLNFSSFSSTTVRAGMLMPSASVSVAKTTFTSLRWKSSSTISLNAGRRPAWWAATPRSRLSRHSQKPRTARSSSGIVRVRSSTI